MAATQVPGYYRLVRRASNNSDILVDPVPAVPAPAPPSQPMYQPAVPPAYQLMSASAQQPPPQPNPPPPAQQLYELVTLPPAQPPQRVQQPPAAQPPPAQQLVYQLVPQSPDQPPPPTQPARQPPPPPQPPARPGRQYVRLLPVENAPPKAPLMPTNGKSNAVFYPRGNVRPEPLPEQIQQQQPTLPPPPPQQQPTLPPPPPQQQPTLPPPPPRQQHYQYVKLVPAGNNYVGSLQASGGNDFSFNQASLGAAPGSDGPTEYYQLMPAGSINLDSYEPPQGGAPPP